MGSQSAGGAPYLICRDGGRENAFLEACLRADWLLLDGVEFWAGKPLCEEMFGRLFPVLIRAGKRIVLNGHCPPDSMGGVGRRIKLHSGSGRFARFRQPSYGDRMRVLAGKIRLRGFDLPEGVVRLLARTVKHSILHMEERLCALAAYREITGERLFFYRRINAVPPGRVISAERRRVTKSRRISRNPTYGTARPRLNSYPITRPKTTANEGVTA